MTPQRSKILKWLITAPIALIVFALAIRPMLRVSFGETESQEPEATGQNIPSARPGEKIAEYKSIEIVPDGKKAAASEASSSGLLERISPSVLRVISTNKDGQKLAQGRGFIVASDGLLITSYHVIKNAQALTILTSDNTQLELQGIAAVDPDTNLALLKLQGNLPPPLKLAADPALAVGATVFSVGRPNGISDGLNQGAIAANDRTLDNIVLRQTTAVTDENCGGGPLINANGEVVGVTTLAFGTSQSLYPILGRVPIDILFLSAKGRITPLSKQTWTLTLAERYSAGLWLAKALIEARGSGPQQSFLFLWIGKQYERCGDLAEAKRVSEKYLPHQNYSGASLKPSAPRGTGEDPATLRHTALSQAASGNIRGAMSTARHIPITQRLEVVREITKTSVPKLDPDAIATVIKTLSSHDEKAAGYVGLAEGILDRGSPPAAPIIIKSTRPKSAPATPPTPSSSPRPTSAAAADDRPITSTRP